MDRLNKSTSANCADKRKKQSSRLRLRWIFLLLMAHTLAWAQDLDYPGEDYVRTLHEWNGEGSGEFQISDNMTVGPVEVVGELYLYPYGNPTITKTSTGHNNIFWTRDGSNGCKLYIIGNASNTLNIYGNCGNGTSSNQTPIPTQTTYSGAGVLLLGNAKCYLKHVVFYGFVTHVGPEGKLTNQGGIVTMGNNSSGGECHMDHVTFRHSYGGPVNPQNRFNYGRIISFVNGVWDVTMDNVTIHDCLLSERLDGHNYVDVQIEGMGSIIRSQGQVGGSLTMTNCTAYNNTYRDLSAKSNITNYQSMEEINAQPLSGQGGVLNWRSGKQPEEEGGRTQVNLNHCNFYNNSARCGGAIATCATITMTNTQIHENEAEQGGGVYFYTYRGQDNPYDGRGFSAIFGENVKVYENVAKYYGGGIYIGIDASDDVGFRAYDAQIDPNGPRDAEFRVEIQTGSEIYKNKAPKGAGIAIRDSAPYKHKNMKKNLIAGEGPNHAFQTWSGEYQRNIIVNGGHVYNNTTNETTGDEMTGAGILVEKYPTTFVFTYNNEDVPSYSYDYSEDYNHSDDNGSGAGLVTVNAESGLIYNNTATNGTKLGYGGGMYIASKFTDPTIVSTLNVNIGKMGENLQALQMYENQAYTDGGGVYVRYDRENDRKNNGTVTVANGTIGKTDLATGNKALHGNGGGICVMGGTVFVNGGNIEYNTAGELGGGVYVSVPNNNSKTTIQGGANISENTAKGGGGVYVDKGELDIIGNRWNPAANSGAGAWELVGWGTNPYNPGEESTHTRITHNTATAGNGGGVNAGNGEVDITNSLIYWNEAFGSVGKGLGGGVYLDGGFIEIVDSKVLNNTAETNGGGVNDHSGDINIYGGDISYNTATNGNGGGVYTNAGDIIIWPGAMKTNSSAPVPDCENTGTTIFSNSAGTNGGGLNTHIGRLDVRFARVRHNVAGASYGPNGSGSGIGGCGGGIYCEGPHADLSGYTVRLIHTNLKNNKAYGRFQGQDMYGCGGGIYLKYGSIFAEHCDIWGNYAHGNGGGLDNHDGELRVYGCIVGKEGTTTENDITYNNKNKAEQGNGGGLNTQQGNIVVGPCDTYGYINSKSSQICHNEAGTNGGGINNHEGDIIIHGDRINHNTAHSGKGGGVYVERGNIDMFGGQINHNHADDPSGGYGGGVYAGGGTFKIMEREANPILEIMEIMDVTTTGFTVHFHHVDRGYAMEDGADDKNFGIVFSTTPFPDVVASENDIPEEGEGVWKINFNVDEGISLPDPHSYIQGKGCTKVVVSKATIGNDLTPNTTYYVIAYGKYTYNEKDYFDASPAVTVTTYGNLPVVVTGVAFDVTATSASVNAKQFYAGSPAPALTARGIEISPVGGNTWTAYPSNSVGDVFSVVITGLSSNAKYKARAYATNSSGTGYGSEIEFTTASSGGGKAAEGNYPKSIYPSVEENPFFMELTPLQQAILASTPEVDTTKQHHSPAAKDDPTPNVDGPVDIPEINYNTATYGGGVCIDKQGAELIFAGTRNSNAIEMGQINYNYASEAGGGIYIGKESAERYAKMQMMGKCVVNFNHVPANKQGGGIYLDGRLYVGDKDTDAIGTHGLKVDQNYAVNGSGAGLPADYTTNGKLNNVFLTRYDYDYNINATSAGDNNVSVITLLSDISGFAGEGNTNPYSHIGFSVLKGFCPVIATSDCFTKVEQGQTVDGNYDLHNLTEEEPLVSSEIWLQNLMRMAGVDSGSGTANTLKGAVFEDSESYVAVHTHTDIPPFRSKFIFLWGCWTHPIVKDDPETNNPMAGEGSGGAWLGHYKIKNPTDNKEITNENPNTTPLEWEIYSPEGLAWFSAYVNGLNAFDEVTGATDDDNNHHAWNKDKNPYAIAHIMNDLDMSAYLWVPIGSVKYFYNNLIDETGGSLFVDSEETLQIGEHKYSDKHKFKGVFDGQGHIITGLQGLYLTGIKKYGLFGYLDGNAVVKNTFVDDGLFVSDDKTVVYSAGGIAGEMNDESVVSNSEARMGFNASYSGPGTALGGLVGDVKGGSIHSSMAMPSFTGHDKGQAGENPTYNAFNGYMGGLAGRLGSGCDLKNSFANSEIVLTTEGTGSTATRHIGGLVGENNGTVENCYSRYFGTTTPTGFGWFAGTNNYAETTVGSGDEQTTEITGVIKYCYAPNGETTYIGNNATTGLTGHGNYGPTVLVSGKYGFKHRDQQLTPASSSKDATTTYISNENNNTLSGGLMTSLNAWVADNTGYSVWTRTMASPINDDYPVIQIADFNSVGSKDGIYMVYEDNINDMWAESGKDFKSCNTAGSNAAMYLYNTNPNPLNVSNNDNVMLAINEEVGILQDDETVLKARVGVTIRNARKGNNDFTTDPNWHLFSSAIKEVPIGLEYHTTEEGYEGVANYQVLLNFRQAMETPTLNNGGGIPNTDYWNRNYMDPPKTTWSEIDVGYFPTNTPYGTWRDRDCNHSTNVNDNGVGGFFDLYSYSEEYYHWVNFKREGKEGFYDHWHMDGSDDGSHEVLTYKNESAMPNGKGYMMALSSESMMMADGLLNTGDIYAPVTLTDVGTHNPRPWRRYDEPWRTLNMIGNPYQSYLDFYEFVFNTEANNKDLLYDVNEDYCYALRDDNNKENPYVYYTTHQSDNPEYSASRFIHPHQGFFVKVKGSGNIKFNNAMRSSIGYGSTFREEHLNYPLVNLLCFDSEGKRDLTTVELKRPEQGGGLKMTNLNASDGLIGAYMDGNLYQTLFTPEGISTIPIHFKAMEDGFFTLHWNTLHGDFSYLHLIDNLTGADVDCLTTDEYKFEGKASDYNSRFKLVFDCTGIDEPETPEPDEGPTVFAFQMGNELIVNGEGVLQMFDLNGRCLMTKQAVGQQSSVSLPQVAAGMYLLRLTSNKQVRVQKMVIK